MQDQPYAQSPSGTSWRHLARCVTFPLSGTAIMLAAGALWADLTFPIAPLAAEVNAFAALTHHVEQSMTEEKRRFHEATACTEWYYKHRPSKPSAPATEPVSWAPPREAPRSTPRIAALSLAQDCPRLYPQGLEEARTAFAQSQTTLSLGLTFYELALVADGNDDGAYDSAELADLFDAMILPSAAAQLDPANALKTKFDIWLKDRNLEQIMTGMGHLYDHGYRLTSRDRADLNRAAQ